jgi:hypothetical protein
LNLPGTDGYDTALPWYFLKRCDELLATILATFVYDERINAASEELAWLAAHQVATREAYLGIQDAARKRRAPSQNVGAWARSIIRTNDTDVGLMVSEERWTKTRKIVRKWLDLLIKEPESMLNTKDLLSDQGFLIYITHTYQCMILHLKGMHLTIDGWRENRDDDGWKWATAHSQQKISGGIQETMSMTNYPDGVKAVPRLVQDLKALQKLTE